VRVVPLVRTEPGHENGKKTITDRKHKRIMKTKTVSLLCTEK
jgi:hypothetical protein